MDEWIKKKVSVGCRCRAKRDFKKNTGSSGGGGVKGKSQKASKGTKQVGSWPVPVDLWSSAFQ